MTTKPEEVRELIERLTYLVQFYIYAEAETKDVADLIEGLEERDSFTGKSGWIIVREDEHDAAATTLDQLLREIERLCEGLDKITRWHTNGHEDGAEEMRQIARATLNQKDTSHE